MKRFWGWLALWTGKRAGTVAIIGLLITLILGMGTTRLKFATSQSSYLNKSDKVYQDDHAYEKLFGGQAMVVMITMTNGKQVEDLFTPSNIAKMKALRKALDDGAKAHQLQSTIDPLLALEFSNSMITKKWVPAANGTPGHAENADITQAVAGSALLGALKGDKSAKGIAARNADTAKTLTRVGAVKGPKNLDNPEWVKFLLYNNGGAEKGEIRKALTTFFPDKHHAELIVRLDGNQALDDQSASANFVADTAAKFHFDNATTITTGAPSLLENINNYLKGGMVLLGGIAAAVMVLILLVLFDVRWRLLPLGVITIGLIWAFGVAGYLGIPLTLATIAGLPVLLGVGIDYAIQLHARVEEEVTINQAEHPIQETAQNLAPALLVVTLDAVFAFAALHFAKVPMIREFGFLLAVGIAVICLTSIVVPLSILGIREYKSPTKRTVSKRSESLGKLVIRMGSLPGKIGGPLIVISLVIFVAGIIAEPKLKLQTDPIQWVNQKSQVIENINALQKGTGSSNELGVYVTAKGPDATVFTQSTINYVDRFTTNELKNNADTLRTANSVVSIVSDVINDVPGAGHVSPNVDSVKAAFELAPPAIRQSFATEDARSLNVIFRTGTPERTPVPLDLQAKVVHGMEHQFAAHDVPPGLSLTPSGLAVVGVGLLENLESNRVLLTYLAIGFVALYLAIRLRSIVRSLLSLIPVLIAVGLSSLVAYSLDLKLSPLTAVGGPLVVAICTEFTSLILLRFVEERGRGYAPRQAVDHTASRTGRAFIVSALTAVSGVAVIATSSMPLLQDFGIIVGLNVLVALLSALVFLPPMLVWAESDGRNWISRHLIPAEVLEAERLRNAANTPGPNSHAQ
ncbi:MAG: MMPL family transporter [Actinobacteria bacterium]|nr:MMPL family transporter [Actinomycetota bacterium]